MKTLLHDMEVRQEGQEEGQARVNLLNAKLGALGRTEDIIKAAADQAYSSDLLSLEYRRLR